ncbi:MAG: hypothetical protein IPO81_18530 [Kouleothrix sp.]|nr:hypothetical protein [Kouleothrix sp.]
MKTNQFELSGFVGNPPDAQFTPDGRLVVTFNLYQGGAGATGAARRARRPKADHRLGRAGQVAQQRLAKGTRVRVIRRIDQQA